LPLRWVLLFLLPSLSHQASSEIFSLKVESPVSGLLGSSVSLHCAVTNNMDVRHEEVRWYRPKMYDTPMLLYENKQIQKSRVDVQYQGRVFLLGDLEKGDVSVKLENLTLTDRGDYVCHVSSDTWYDEAVVSLRMRAMGSTPVFCIREAGGGQVNVSCQSHGWLPEPSITWTDKDGRDLKHLSNDKFTHNSVGTVDVSSWLIVSPSESEWISCSVGLSDQERQEDRIMLRDTESLTGYIIIIPVLLVLCVIGIAVYCVLRKKGLILCRRKGTESTGAGTQSETEPLNKIRVENQDQTEAPSPERNSKQSAETPPTAPPSEVSQQESSEQQNPGAVKDQTHCADLDQVKKYKVNISIDPEGNPESLIHEGNAVKSSECFHPNSDIPDNVKIFTLCKEKFQSGQHYWEVKIQFFLVHVKLSEHTLFRTAMITALPLRWVLLFLLPSLSHQASSEIFSVKVESPVSGLLGSSVSLHCAVTNNMDVRHEEVRWYRPKMYDTPILLYENKQIQKSRVDVQYQGRVFLLGDLEKGDVSVKLENLTLADRGDYVCHVSTDNWYDKATVTLRLRVMGSTPVLSIREAGGGQVNVSCQSHGWLPEPSITWTDKDGRDLKHLSNDKFTHNSVGTVDVSSWLIVSPSESEWISCSVGLSDQERQEGRIILHVPARDTESLTGYIIIIPVLLVLCVVGIAVYCVLRKKGLILCRRKGTESTGAGTQSETEPLNKIRVENQDQTEAPSTETGPDVFTTNTPPAVFIRNAPPVASMRKTPPAASTTNAPPAVFIRNAPPVASMRKTPPAACTTNNTPAASTTNTPPAVFIRNTPPTASMRNPRRTEPMSENSYNLDQVKKYKVNISIDPEGNPESLIHEGNAVKSSECFHPNSDIPDHVKIFTLCKEKFQSGQHYWEVKVKKSQETVKLS
ncbi:butyrophilin subfamily 1 member A1-like, partial [Clarias magur]